MSKAQNFKERCGSFHTQSNLAQALLDIMIQHYNSVHDNKQVMPSFLKMAISNLCNNLSCIVNGNGLNMESWENIKVQSELVIDLVEKAIAAEQQLNNNKEEQNGNT